MRRRGSSSAPLFLREAPRSPPGEGGRGGRDSARAFSSEVDTGSRHENASTKSEPVLIQSEAEKALGQLAAEEVWFRFTASIRLASCDVGQGAASGRPGDGRQCRDRCRNPANRDPGRSPGRNSRAPDNEIPGAIRPHAAFSIILGVLWSRSRQPGKHARSQERRLWSPQLQCCPSFAGSSAAAG